MPTSSSFFRHPIFCHHLPSISRKPFGQQELSFAHDDDDGKVIKLYDSYAIFFVCQHANVGVSQMYSIQLRCLTDVLYTAQVSHRCTQYSLGVSQMYSVQLRCLTDVLSTAQVSQMYSIQRRCLTDVLSTAQVSHRCTQYSVGVSQMYSIQRRCLTDVLNTAQVSHRCIH